ncbi:MAG: TRAP transporter substrate-binding protein [Clostridiales Family XIII bacterium]|jgi:TRAP-type C4-dicarboxylate transport system substrate-binding protein|nr:TRAP transporter substrate-binding protein [Clostridiales Family XIII bacterium]
MKKKRFVLLALLMAAALVFAACGGSGTETPPADTGTDTEAGDAAAPPDNTVYNLVLTSHEPPDSRAANYINTWAAAVEEASGGRLITEINFGGALGGPTQTIDLILNGSVDLGFGLQSFYPNMFPMTDTVCLPMLPFDDSVQASKVFWDFYENYDFMKDEYSQYKVILLRTNSSAPIATNKVKLERVDQVKGMNVRAMAGPLNDFIISMGGSPVGVSIADLYSAMQNNTLDAATTDWHGLYSFKIYEPTKYYADEKLLYNTYFFLMNKDSYAKLPADLQAVIDEFSGENALNINIDDWNTIEETAKETVLANGGDVYTLPEAEHEKLLALAGQVQTNWISGMEAQGFPAQEAYDTVIELAQKYAN